MDDNCTCLACMRRKSMRSMYLPESTIDEIRKKATSMYIHVTDPCPFCGAGPDSFKSKESWNGYLMFHCFNCNWGGDVIALLMKKAGARFTNVVKFLAKKTGVQLPEDLAEKCMRKVRE